MIRLYFLPLRDRRFWLFVMLVTLALSAFAGELDDCRVTVTPAAESKPKPVVAHPRATTAVVDHGTAKPKRKWTPKTRVYHTTQKDEWEIVCDEPALPPSPMEVLAGPIEPPQFTPVPPLEPSPTKPEPLPCDCFAEAAPGFVPPFVPFPGPAFVVPYVPLPPAPEPETWLMLAVGLGFVAWRRNCGDLAASLRKEKP